MPQPGIPPRGKLEKKAVCSPCCGDGTTSYSDRAFGIIAQRSLQGNCFQAECTGRWIVVHDAAAVLRLSGRMRREAEGGREADEAYRDVLFVYRAGWREKKNKDVGQIMRGKWRAGRGFILSMFIERKKKYFFVNRKI